MEYKMFDENHKTEKERETKIGQKNKGNNNKIIHMVDINPTIPRIWMVNGLCA